MRLFTGEKIPMSLFYNCECVSHLQYEAVNRILHCIYIAIRSGTCIEIKPNSRENCGASGTGAADSRVHDNRP